MKKHLFIVALFISAIAQAQVKQTVTKADISYEIKNLGINTHGVFSGLKADINFDPKHLSASSIEASIDATSLNSDNDLRDKHLKSDDYFDIEKYPKITMRSVSFKSKGGNNYTGIFNVTIKDKTNTANVDFTYTETAKTCSFKGVFKINRKDFGVGGSSITLANEAKVNVNIDTAK